MMRKSANERNSGQVHQRVAPPAGQCLKRPTMSGTTTSSIKSAAPPGENFHNRRFVTPMELIDRLRFRWGSMRFDKPKSNKLTFHRYGKAPPSPSLIDPCHRAGSASRSGLAIIGTPSFSGRNKVEQSRIRMGCSAADRCRFGLQIDRSCRPERRGEATRC
jgi:hypothetical protein